MSTTPRPPFLERLGLVRGAVVVALIAMVCLVGMPLIVDAVLGAAKMVGYKYDEKKARELQIKAITISDRSEYMVVVGTVVGIMSAVYFHATEFLEHDDEPVWTVILFHVLPSFWINAGMLYHFYHACVQNAGKPTADCAEGGRKCRQCGGPQPISTWHCTTCDQCVMYMDHHCPFTANCVGHANYPFFFGFVFWAWMATVYATWLTFHPHLHCDAPLSDGTVSCEPSTKRKLLWASVAMCVVVTGFFGFVVYLLVSGTTTRGFLDSEVTDPLKSLRGQGILHNVQFRLGPKSTWWRYLVPFTLGARATFMAGEQPLDI